MHGTLISLQSSSYPGIFPPRDTQRSSTVADVVPHTHHELLFASKVASTGQQLRPHARRQTAIRRRLAKAAREEASSTHHTWTCACRARDISRRHRRLVGHPGGGARAERSPSLITERTDLMDAAQRQCSGTVMAKGPFAQRAAAACAGPCIEPPPNPAGGLNQRS